MGTNTGTVAEQLSRFCTQLRFERLPTEATQRARELLLDYLGVAWGGMRTESSQAALRAGRALGGPGPSTVVGQPEGATAALAAMVNGTAAHALEMDDVTTRSSLHPAVAVFPAVLALSEELEAPSDRALLAAVIGYEVMMRVGAALNPLQRIDVDFTLPASLARSARRRLQELRAFQVRLSRRCWPGCRARRCSES